MDPLIQVNDDLPTCREGRQAYLYDHAACDRESGVFYRFKGYLCRNGASVRPHLNNPELWTVLGLKPGEELPPPALIGSILEGKDRFGRTLVASRTPGGKAIHEILLTVPCELSELASKMHPGFGLELLEALRWATLEHVQARAVEVRTRPGVRECRAAEVLGLGFPHGENRRGEPHLHMHLILLPIAWDSVDLKWRTLNLRNSVKTLHSELRPIAAEALRRVCQKWGVSVAFEPGLGGNRAGPAGWSVRLDGHPQILAGSCRRVRTPQVLARDLLRMALGGRVPTMHEFRQLVQACQYPSGLRPPPIQFADLGSSHANKTFDPKTLLGPCTADPWLIHLDRGLAFAQTLITEMACGKSLDDCDLGLASRYRSLVSRVLPPGLTAQHTKEAEVHWGQMRRDLLSGFKETSPPPLTPIHRIALRTLETQGIFRNRHDQPESHPPSGRAGLVRQPVPVGRGGIVGPTLQFRPDVPRRFSAHSSDSALWRRLDGPRDQGKPGAVVSSQAGFPENLEPRIQGGLGPVPQHLRPGMGEGHEVSRPQPWSPLRPAADPAALPGRGLAQGSVGPRLQPPHSPGGLREGRTLWCRPTGQRSLPDFEAGAIRHHCRHLPRRSLALAAGVQPGGRDPEDQTPSQPGPDRVLPWSLRPERRGVSAFRHESLRKHGQEPAGRSLFLGPDPFLRIQYFPGVTQDPEFPVHAPSPPCLIPHAITAEAISRVSRKVPAEAIEPPGETQVHRRR